MDTLIVGNRFRGTPSYWDNVVLYLKGDGVNNSTSIIDSSSYAKPVSVFGNAKIVTDQSKFGGSSIYLDGDGDYLSLASSGDWLMPGDYTIHFWMRVPVLSGVSYTKGIIGNQSVGSGGGISIGQYQGAINSDGWTTSENILSINTWHHIALVKTGGTAKIYIDGIERRSYAKGSNVSSQLIIGNFGDQDANRWMTGWIDELIIVKDVALFTENFTPPTTPLLP